jgi:hypothetical protein
MSFELNENPFDLLDDKENNIKVTVKPRKPFSEISSNFLNREIELKNDWKTHLKESKRKLVPSEKPPKTSSLTEFNKKRKV